MKVMPALDEAHFNETIPVMAALSVFEAACGKGLSGSGMLYLVGAELTKSPVSRERHGFPGSGTRAAGQGGHGRRWRR
jgi:hypothetical protein